MKKHIFSFILIILTLFLFINHLGTVVPKKIAIEEERGPNGIRIEKSEKSHRHIILEGSDYHRGSEFGRINQNEILMLENLLVSKLDHFIGNSFFQRIFFSFAMVWFYDEADYIDLSSLKEMQGVSKWASSKFDYLSSALTRQLAYHGLHEVGQIFVDDDRVDLGCFASAIQSKNNEWVIGRNFDFDVEGVFDKEKILKWVYPDDGIPYLSIIWAGMVGAVTGINQQGIFVAINAAGSDDFSRVGTPTTIVVKNILSKCKTLEEAVALLKESHVFITDIFIMADRKSNRVVIVEKSPLKMDVHYLKKSSVVANHLQSNLWPNDKNNENRKSNLTSEWRFKRGQEIIKEGVFDFPVEKTVEILRDKSLMENKKGHLGHRGAIDSLIASQSVIYDMANGLIYVNQGPGTSGEYLGYDIDKSFIQKKPIVTNILPGTNISEFEYHLFQKRLLLIGEAKKYLNKKECDKVKEILFQIKSQDFIHYEHERLVGDYFATCLNDFKTAKIHWSQSLDFNPPYEKQRKYLREKLQ